MKIKDYYDKVMQSFRCSNCNKLLFKGKIRGDNHIEIVCGRCKSLNIFDKKVIFDNKKEK